VELLAREPDVTACLSHVDSLVLPVSAG
jgi:hypothetical protein